MGRPFVYHDDWTLEHTHDYTTIKDLNRAYNDRFNCDISYGTFKCYVRRLGIKFNTFNYTVEMDDFLRKTYPELGINDTAKLFNETFRTNISAGAIKVRCNKVLGLRVSSEGRRINHSRYSRRSAIGDTAIRNGRKYIKKSEDMFSVQHNWVPYSNYIYELANGPIPEDNYIIHLDRDPLNDSLDNLCCISSATMARMTANDLWFHDKELTRTGVYIAELRGCIKDDRRFDEEDDD